MGRIAGERHIHFGYTPEFVDHWNEQSDEFKQKMEDLGKPNGYTGMNVFFVFFVQYWSHLKSNTTRVAFRKAL